MNLTDVGCVYRIMKRESLEKIVDKLTHSGTDKPIGGVGIGLYFTMQCIENDQKIIEIPVTFKCSDVVCLELITLADVTSPTVILGVPVNPDALVAVVAVVAVVALVAVSALPVTSPVKAPTKVVAVAIPATIIPAALAVTAEPTTTEVVKVPIPAVTPAETLTFVAVAKPVILAPSGKLGAILLVRPLKLVTRKVAI